MAIASFPENITEDRRLARIVRVEHLIRMENDHDLEGVLNTFGAHCKLRRRGLGRGLYGRERSFVTIARALARKLLRR